MSGLRISPSLLARRASPTQNRATEAGIIDFMHEHTWVSREEIAKMNLISCKGEVGLVDMFPTPKDGNLMAFEEKMRSLQESFKNNA